MVLAKHLSILMILILSTFVFNVYGANLGEKNFSHYYGPNFPLVQFSKYSNKYTFKDDRDKENLINQQISSELFSLKNFFEAEYFFGYSCPDKIYKENYKYIEYLFRLVNLSYLFESLRTYEFTSKQFKANNICQIDWKKEFNSCQPKSQEMKSFVKNATSISSVLGPVIVPFSTTRKDVLNQWVTDYNNNKLSDITQYRIHSHCLVNDCRITKPSDVASLVSSICQNDLSQFQRICSEVDRGFGVSSIPELFNAVSHSNAIRNIDQTGHAQGCVKRYISQNKVNEESRINFKNSFSLLYEEKSEDKDLQGRLFSIGAMREFTEKGISDLFSKKPKSVAKKVKKKKNNRVQNPPQFEIIELPKFVKIKKPKKIKKKTKPLKKAEPVFSGSSFLKAVLFREKFKLERLNLDMSKFRYDYLFTVSRARSLAPVVERFGKYKVLEQMKKSDALGSSKAPIPLIYIKFLIEESLDQLLFNITNVIGNEFYIINDIDENIKSPTRISLLNNRSTYYKWQIVILE